MAPPQRHRRTPSHPHPASPESVTPSTSPGQPRRGGSALSHPTLGRDRDALVPWLSILDQAHAGLDDGSLVHLARAGSPHDVAADFALGLLPLALEHPLDVLARVRVEDEWLALGVVTHGWAAPMAEGRPSQHPARQRVRTTVLVDRSGNVASRVTTEDGAVLIEVSAPEGTVIDRLRRALGLPGQ